MNPSLSLMMINSSAERNESDRSGSFEESGRERRTSSGPHLLGGALSLSLSGQREKEREERESTESRFGFCTAILKLKSEVEVEEAGESEVAKPRTSFPRSPERDRERDSNSLCLCVSVCLSLCLFLGLVTHNVFSSVSKRDRATSFLSPLLREEREKIERGQRERDP